MSLRKQKKTEIITSKRKRAINEEYISESGPKFSNQSPSQDKTQASSTVMTDQTETEMERMEKDLVELMNRVYSLVPPEKQDANWVSALKILKIFSKSLFDEDDLEDGTLTQKAFLNRTKK